MTLTLVAAARRRCVTLAALALLPLARAAEKTLRATASATASADTNANATATRGAAPDALHSLGLWNRVFMGSTIVLFLLLTLVAGREIWTEIYSRRAAAAAASSNASATAAAAAGAGTSASANVGPKGSGMYGATTPMGAPLGVTASASLLEDEASASLSTGAEMRHRFFLLLVAASAIRVCSLIVQVSTLQVAAAAPRLLTLFLWLPSLLFVSMYGLVLLFWAQLCYACWGKAYPWPRRVFFAFNVLLYSAFVVLLLAMRSADAFWQGCDLLLGCVYALGLVGMLYYSVRLIQFFRSHGPDEEFFFDLPTNAASPYRRAATSPRQIVLRRITAVCIILSVLFAVKAVYLVTMGLKGSSSEGAAELHSPIGVHHVGSQFVVHFVTEFVPGALLVFITRKQRKSASSASQPSNSKQSTAAAGAGKPTTPSFGLRGRTHSSNNSIYQDDTVGSGSLSGYQYQAAVRGYGTSTVPGAARGPTTGYYGNDNGLLSATNPSVNHSTTAGTSSSSAYV
ncbi:hypothetical protein P43SY_009754 [Pythium insidiosum]|uniref:THH1/TOM1/TOM3 domain-containing protein n=1 Tax=Pythium insidiosum TaxID=114742 RepID=A0AAD5QDE9_PYTIN|nr:hypothetical protein P43SY_009754 [Pythium insidiosum]